MFYRSNQKKPSDVVYLEKWARSLNWDAHAYRPCLMQEARGHQLAVINLLLSISRASHGIVLSTCTGVIYKFEHPHLSFAGWALFLLLPLLCLSSPPPQLGAHTALKVRHLPESHAATQSQQLGQTHTVHCRRETHMCVVKRKYGALRQVTPCPCRPRQWHSPCSPCSPDSWDPSCVWPASLLISPPSEIWSSKRRELRWSSREHSWSGDSARK